MADKVIYIKSDPATHKTDAPVIALKLNEIGYWPIYTRATPEELNGPNVTPEIALSAEMGSMFGWDIPGAKAARDYLEKAE